LKSASASDSTFIREQWHSLKELSFLVNRKAPGAMTMNERQAEFLAVASKMDLKTAGRVADASEIINQRRPELNTPAFVAQNLMGLIGEFTNDLEESGIDPKRISRLQMWNATRRIGNGRLDNSADVGHVVLVMDRGEPRESTMDVGISMFAPVADPNRPVADQYDTKYSPFGYAPLISTVDTYKQERYLWFQHFRYLDS
jgi:hypothetical protein